MAGRPALRKVEAQIRKLGGETYIFERIAAGETIAAVADSLNISRPVLSTWCNQDKRRDALTHARRIAAGTLAEETLRIADQDLDPDQVQAAKLRIDTRKWLAARMAPETWGEQRGPTVAIQINGLHLDALRQGGRVIEHGDD